MGKSGARKEAENRERARRGMGGGGGLNLAPERKERIDQRVLANSDTIEWTHTLNVPAKNRHTPVRKAPNRSGAERHNFSRTSHKAKKKGMRRLGMGLGTGLENTRYDM